MQSLSTVHCAETVQLALRCFSERMALNIGVHSVCSWEGPAQHPPMPPSWTHFLYSLLQLSLLRSWWQLFLYLETSNEVLRWSYWESYSANHHTTAQVLFLLPSSLCSKENTCSLTASTPKLAFCFTRALLPRSTEKNFTSPCWRLDANVVSGEIHGHRLFS